MKILITGSCGFVGNQMANRIKQSWLGVRLIGLDYFTRNGSELNCADAASLCETFLHIDQRLSDHGNSNPLGRSHLGIDQSTNERDRTSLFVHFVDVILSAIADVRRRRC